MSKLVRKSLHIAAVSGMLCAIIALIGCTQTTTVSGTVSSQSGVSATVTHVIVWDPPGSYLVNFDATKALLQLSLSNAKVASTTGTATVSVKDLTTGQVVGQQSFGYVISGTSVYAQSPSTVYNWLQQFTGYADIEVTTNLPTLLQSVDSTSSSSVIGAAQYLGTTYASGSVGWEPVSTNCTGGSLGFNQKQLCAPGSN